MAWATGGTVQRGFLQITDTTYSINNQNRASFGDISLAFGPATNDFGDIVSLGDSGIATLTFDYLIVDGPGADFAVFENGFANNYMELAHVEVSSDGVHYFRFPSTSEVPMTSQQSNGSFSDCRMVNNLAGKYRIGYGTPFDLSEIPDQPFFERNNIHFVRIIDAIGNIGSEHFTVDQFDTKINDPFPTPFESGGFDLEAIGVINGSLPLQLIEQNSVFRCFPNPALNEIKVQGSSLKKITISNQLGQCLYVNSHPTENNAISIDFMNSGYYVIQLEFLNGEIATQSLIKQ
jgi:hypothetical protein